MLVTTVGYKILLMSVLSLMLTYAGRRLSVQWLSACKWLSVG